MGLIDSYRFVPRNRSNTSRDYEILPDAHFDLAFLLSESACKMILAGPYTQKAIVPLDHFELIIVHFKVGRLPSLIDIHPCELVNTMIELPHICALDGDTIGEWLQKRKTIPLKRELIENILGDAATCSTAHDKIYENAIALIDTRDGQIKVEELARTLGISNRTLERKFGQALGIPPKKFANLVRFQRTVKKIESHSAGRSLVDIAYESGYADQAHFIRDFKSLSGSLPGSFCDKSQSVEHEEFRI